MRKRQAEPNASKHAEELTRIRRQLATDPGNWKLHTRAAAELLFLKDFKGTESEAKRAIELAPEEPLAHCLLSMAMVKRFKLARAEAEVREAIRLNPEKPMFYAVLGALLATRRRWDPALEAFDAGLRVDPENEACRTGRVEVLSKLGRTDEAMALVLSGLRHDPDSSEAHAALGETHLRGGQVEQAIPAFREALRIDPENRSAIDGLIKGLRATFPLYGKAMQLAYASERWPLWVSMLAIAICTIVFQMAPNIARHYPVFRPFFLPVMLASGAVAYSRALGPKIGDILLLFHPDGRSALGRRRVVETAVAAAFLALGIACACVTLHYKRLWLGAVMALLAFAAVCLPTEIQKDRAPGKSPINPAIFWWVAFTCAAAVIGAFAWGPPLPHRR